MRISEILKTKAVTVSCELFPPKQGSELSNTRQIVREIAGLRPSFMSVTYGPAVRIPATRFRLRRRCRRTA